MNPRRAFTLIEILVVLSIIAVLAAIILPQLFSSTVSGEIASTQSRIDSISMAAKTYEGDWGDYPPGRLSLLKILKIEVPDSNGINEGSEALVLALATERKKGPYTTWADDWLENTDGDKLPRAAEKNLMKVPELYEVVDFWGNPLVYIHCRDYGKTFKVRDNDGNTVTVRAQKSKKTGTYYNPNSFQLWSFGPDLTNNNGREDDVANFAADDDAGAGDEGPP